MSNIDSFLTRWEKVIKGLRMPNDLVVVRNRDADEAGDYRVMRHCEAVNDPQWEITDIDAAEFLRD
jgi:hypothetical protein